MTRLKNALRRIAGAPTIEQEKTNREIQTAAVMILEANQSQMKALQEENNALRAELEQARKPPAPADPPEPQTCNNCLYYRDAMDPDLWRIVPTDLGYTGICVQQPPKVLNRETSAFPPVHFSDCCGHHWPAPPREHDQEPAADEKETSE